MTTKREIAEDLINGIRVNTMGFDFNLTLSSENPRYFETMAFEGEHEVYKRQYATEPEAVVGHTTIIKYLASGRSVYEIDD